MAIYRNDIVDIDLESGSLHRCFLNHSIGEGDAEGNRYGVRVFRNKAAVDLTGCSVIGYFIRADKATSIITGVASGNTAYVSLPQECYAKEGVFSLAIQLIGGGVTGTMRIIDGSVINTTTDAIIDPGGVVPDLDELMAVIERAEDAADDIADLSVGVLLNSGEDYTLVVSTS